MDVEARDVAPGLWLWRHRHREWREGNDWEPDHVRDVDLLIYWYGIRGYGP